MDGDAFAALWRADIPLLRDKKCDFIYLDSAASLLKPQPVIDALLQYYYEFPVNIHRSTSHIGERANATFEEARTLIAQFFSLTEDYVVIFVAGMTDGSNLLANAYREILEPQDVVSTTMMEHHSSLLPWREVTALTQSKFQIVDMLPSGRVDLDMLYDYIKESRVLTISGMSNVTGYKPPLKDIYHACEKVGCRMIVDAAQLAIHAPISLADTPFDALLCSAHKLGGPTGIGALCIKKSWLESMVLRRIGGGTVNNVSLTKTSFRDIPERYEAGTPHIAGAIGFGAATKYVRERGWNEIQQYEQLLRTKIVEAVRTLDNVELVGDEDISDAAMLSFSSPLHHSYDIGFFLEQHNISIRNGRLCAAPLLHRYQYNHVARISAFCYNTIEEIDFLGEKLAFLNDIFRKK